MVKRVLIVDDEEDIRNILKDQFEELHYEVVTASNGQIALDKTLESSFDVIVSDIRMPEMDGLTLVKNIRETNKEVPIYLVTAFSEYSEKDILVLGVSAIIFKPFDADEIVEVIDHKVRGLSDEES